MTTTEDARQTLADLEGTLAGATTRATELQVERRRLAFDANTGDEGARKRLDKLNAQSATADLEIENIRSALEEAKRRLAEAERSEAMAAQRENATQAVEIAGRLVRRGDRIEDYCDGIIEELAGYKADVDALHLLGCAGPTGQQFLVYGGLAVSTFLMKLPVKAERGHLAPGERRSWRLLSITWRDSVMRWASSFLDKEAA